MFKGRISNVSSSGIYCASAVHGADLKSKSLLEHQLEWKALKNRFQTKSLLFYTIYSVIVSLESLDKLGGRSGFRNSKKKKKKKKKKADSTPPQGVKYQILWEKPFAKIEPK